MAPCDLNGALDAKVAGAARANRLAIHARLCAQVLKCGIQIARPPSFPVRGAVGFGVVLAAASAVCAAVHGEHVDAGCCELRRQFVPRLASSVALMEQQHARAWLPCGEVSSL